jgi:organic hydroperoxide reductase OsmC/OhrA
MSEERTHHVTVSLARNYEFVAEFPDVAAPAAVLFDEPAPLGGGRAPNAAAMLGAAVGNCLAASLAFCLRKSRVDVDGLTAHITTRVAKNDQGKFRISGIDVELAPEFDAANQAKFDRCEHLFEDFCIVTQSVRQGIPVNVTVKEREVVASR